MLRKRRGLFEYFTKTDFAFAASIIIRRARAASKRGMRGLHPLQFFFFFFNGSQQVSTTKTVPRHKAEMTWSAHWGQRSPFASVSVPRLVGGSKNNAMAALPNQIDNQRVVFNVHKCFLDPPRFCHPSPITRAEQDMRLSHKRSAQTARQAHPPRVINWRRNCWTMPYPLGIGGVPARVTNKE